MSIRRNTAYNLLGSVFPMAVSLVTTPMYLSLIGEARYGALAVTWLLLGYFGLFDLGLGRATAQRIAALRDGTAEERHQTFWTALAINAVIGVVGGLLIWPVSEYFFAYTFQIEDSMRLELKAAIPWLMLAVPIATTSAVFGGALQGRERFLELNLISVTGTILSQLLPFAIAVYGNIHLGVLIPAALFARMLTLLLLAWRCRRNLALHRPVVSAHSQAVQLMRFGGWISVSALVSPLMVIADRFIIGAIAGAQAVTYYSVPFQLAERSTMLAGALTSTLFPRFAAIRRDEQLFLARQGLRGLVVVTTPLFSVGIILIDPFLTWWITPEFAAHSSLIAQIILLGFWLNSFARIPFVQLQARGRPDIVAKCHLGELLPYFALLYFGLHYFGLTGAAIAFSLRVVVDFLLLSGFAGMLRLSAAMLWFPVAILVSATLIATRLQPGSEAWYMLLPIHLILTAFWAWRNTQPFLVNVLMRKSFSNKSD